MAKNQNTGVKANFDSMKSQKITLVNTIYPEREMNFYNEFHADPSKSFLLKTTNINFMVVFNKYLQYISLYKLNFGSKLKVRGSLESSKHILWTQKPNFPAAHPIVVEMIH